MDLEKIVKNALKEDIGSGDITTNSIVPGSKVVKAVLLAKEDCVVCGLGTFLLALRSLDKNIKFKNMVSDGDWVKKGKQIARISGCARAILTAERVALNFFSHLCGISTITRKYVLAVKAYKAKILDTRKTIPGLRSLEKYAVRIGGGFNHRSSLDEMILIKDNHLRVIGGYRNLNKDITKFKRKGLKVELEVNNLREFKQALNLKPDIIMLDNMSIKDIKKTVKIRDYLSPKTCNLIPQLEASGGVSLKNVRKIASAGVDLISIGELTHSAPSVDISLEIL
ncbi:MAG: carboxylating nicotinate-nucleotide diphosphorylase [Candidatus Omnitrophica bacterium]|nr:carboxylating nicotinate-nucleotide diphosphorylase [Candidatus Omnitrophota bacterium]